MGKHLLSWSLDVAKSDEKEAISIRSDNVNVLWKGLSKKDPIITKKVWWKEYYIKGWN